MSMNLIDKLDKKIWVNPNQKAVALLVADILQDSGLTQKEFAMQAGIAFSTFTNILRPYYAHVPSIDTITKVANQTEYPKRTLQELMQASGYDENGNKTKIDNKKAQELQQVLEFVFYLSKVNLVGTEFKVKDTDIKDHSIIFEYADKDFDYWMIDVCTDTCVSRLFIQTLLYSIVTELPNCNYKYSILTTSKEVSNSLQKLCMPTLNLSISVIEHIDNTYTEIPLHTMRECPIFIK